MALFPDYPIILYPKADIKEPRITRRSGSSRQYKADVDYSAPKKKNFNLHLLKLGFKATRWLGYLFSGIVFFSMGLDVFQGDYYSLIPGFLMLAIKTGIIWLLEKGLARLEAAALDDQAEAEHEYWQDLKKSNQDYLTQIEAQSYRSNFSQSFDEKELIENPNITLVYTRGVQQINSNKGVSETYFEKYLRKYFSDCEISSDYFALNDKIGYSTDFSLLPPAGEVAIDIEIDEPYQGKSKQPHHCQDEGKDHRRNLYFLERGWIVVRFSEYQIALYPDSCCREIAKVLGKYSLHQYIEAFEDIAELQPDQSWTVEDAKALVHRQFREKYLEETGIFKQPSKMKLKNSCLRGVKRKKMPTK